VRVPLPSGAVQAVRITVGLLVDMHYDTLERMTRHRHLTADMMRGAIEQYGRTLVRPPAEAYHDLDGTAVEHGGRAAFAVEFPLWTEEEGRSALELDLVIVEALAGVYVPELNGIRVC
jgi:hypothetical protein